MTCIVDTVAQFITVFSRPFQAILSILNKPGIEMELEFCRKYTLTPLPVMTVPCSDVSKTRSQRKIVLLLLEWLA